VVADQVDVLVLGVVNAGDRAVGQLDSEPSELGEVPTIGHGLDPISRRRQNEIGGVTEVVSRRPGPPSQRLMAISRTIVGCRLAWVMSAWRGS